MGNPERDPMEPEGALPLAPPSRAGIILALCADEMILPRLQDVARGLGFEFDIIASSAQLGVAEVNAPRIVPLTEPLEGPDGAFMRHVVEHRPALIVADLTAADVPWAQWIQVLKTSAATRRIPVVAFGPHVAEADLARARQAGADVVMARGAFLRNLPDVLQRHAAGPDHAALRAACQGSLSDRARAGIELINRGEFFEAHEVLEHAWMEAPPADGTVYRALLQVAVAMLQVERKNPRGAAKMVLRVRQWLDPLPDRCMGLDLAAVKRRVAELDASLRAGELPPYQITIPLPG